MSGVFAALMLLTGLGDLSQFQVDSARLEAELAADADVVRSLKSNGDQEHIVRAVDVRFVGPKAAISKLKKALGAEGWKIVQTAPVDDGQHALDVSREQTTDAAALRQLTETALRIEIAYGVHYDGWGTVAQTGSSN